MQTYKELQNKRAILWTRVSSKQQQDKGASLETQKEYCKNYAHQNGIEIVKEFGGKCESAKNIEGKYFQEMKDAAHSIQGINVILVYSFDRFNRSTMAIPVADELWKEGIFLISATEVTDWDSSLGRKYIKEGLLRGNTDNDYRQEKINIGIQAHVDRGNYRFRVPQGYQRIKTGSQLQIHITEEGEKLKKMWDLKIQGYSLQQIYEYLFAEGLFQQMKPKNAVKMISKMLKNSIYCGIVHTNRHKDGCYHCDEIPHIVDEETFNVANGLSTHTGYTQVKEPQDFPLNGIIHCACCGGAISGYKNTQRKKNIHYYYKCSHRGCLLNERADKMHDLFCQMLHQYQIKRELLPILEKIMKNELSEHDRENQKHRTTLHKQKIEIETEINTCEDAFYFPSREIQIPKEVFDRKMKMLKDKLEIIENQLKECVVDVSNTTRLLDIALAMSSKLDDLWQKGDFNDKQELANLLFPEGLSYDKTKSTYLTPKVNSCFGLFALLSDSYNALKRKNDFSFSLKSLFVEKRRLERPIAHYQNFGQLFPLGGADETRTRDFEINH